MADFVKKQSEKCLLEVPSIMIVIESGVGIHTIPLISMEMKITSEIKNWTSEVSLRLFYNLRILQKVSYIDATQRIINIFNGLL